MARTSPYELSQTREERFTVQGWSTVGGCSGSRNKPFPPDRRFLSWQFYQVSILLLLSPLSSLPSWPTSDQAQTRPQGAAQNAHPRCLLRAEPSRGLRAEASNFGHPALLTLAGAGLIAAAYRWYAGIIVDSAALHMDIFEQPVPDLCFRPPQGRPA